MDAKLGSQVKKKIDLVKQNLSKNNPSKELSAGIAARYIIQFFFFWQREENLPSFCKLDNSSTFTFEDWDQHTSCLNDQEKKLAIDVFIITELFCFYKKNFQDKEKDYFLFQKVFEISIAEKSQQGIFYTDNKLVKRMVKDSLGQILKREKRKLNINCFLEKVQKNENLKTISLETLWAMNSYRNFLLHVKVLDPACGGGAFLIETFCLLKEEHLVLNKVIEEFFSFEDIIKNNLFGCDQDQQAVFVARLSLEGLLEKKLCQQNQNIFSANFLIEDTAIDKKAFQWQPFLKKIHSPKGFDLILTNPPYVSYYSRFSQKKQLPAKVFSYWQKEFGFCNSSYSGKRFNTVMFFIEKAISLCKANGMVAFVLDRNILEKPFFDIRQWLCTNSHLKKVVLELQEFKQVNSGQVLLFTSGQKRIEPTYKTLFINEDKKECFTKSFEQLQNDSFSFEKIEENSILIKLELCQTLDQFVKIYSGVNIGGARDRFIATHKESNEYFFYVTSKDLKRSFQYVIPNKEYILFNESLVQKINKENNQKQNNSVVSLGKLSRFQNQKIFIRQSASRIMAGISSQTIIGSYNLFVVENLHSTDLFLLGWLNSKLLSYYAIQKKLIRMGKGKQCQIRKSALLQLPTPVPNKQIQELVKNILSIEKNIIKEPSNAIWKQRETWVNKLDVAFFDLFALNTNEQKTIIEFFKK